MCSQILCMRNGITLAVTNLPCCVPLERLTALDPQFCAERGWRSLGGWSPKKGERVSYIQLPADLTARLAGVTTSALPLEYKGRVVHLRSDEQARVMRKYIAARLRRAQDFPDYRSFLEQLPHEMITARARAPVTKRLDALIAAFSA